MDQKPRYRRGVGMIILNSKNQIFIGQRFDKDKSAWQMPQGGIDKGESPAKAVIREMKEETGIKKNYNFPLTLTASMTRPLTDEEFNSIGNPKEWGVLPVRPMGAPIGLTGKTPHSFGFPIELNSSSVNGLVILAVKVRGKL